MVPQLADAGPAVERAVREVAAVAPATRAAARRTRRTVMHAPVLVRRPCADACRGFRRTPMISFSGSCWVPPRSADPGGVHPAELLLELADLVAEPRRQLEVQLPGGLVHLVLQLLDELGQLGPRHAREVLGVLAGAALGLH